jgi:hypothetical protein
MAADIPGGKLPQYKPNGCRPRLPRRSRRRGRPSAIYAAEGFSPSTAVRPNVSVADAEGSRRCQFSGDVVLDAVGYRTGCAARVVTTNPVCGSSAAAPSSRRHGQSRRPSRLRAGLPRRRSRTSGQEPKRQGVADLGQKHQQRGGTAGDGEQAGPACQTWPGEARAANKAATPMKV